MNERFAVEPDACSNAAELRLLLERFGPFAGRYIATLPAGWESNVREKTNTWSPIEAKRAAVLLQRAAENKALLRINGVPFDRTRDWVDNAEAALAGGRIQQMIVNRTHAGRHPCIDDISLSPTADEAVYGTAEEYIRVSSSLIMVSPELALVDPYLDPCLGDRAIVLTAFFQKAANFQVRKITLWVSAAKVTRPVEELEESLRRIARHSGFRRGYIDVRLVDDRFSTYKLHARYLLSIRGAIRFDQGFQELKRRKVDVSVVGVAVHAELVSRFLEGRHDFQVAETTPISIR